MKTKENIAPEVSTGVRTNADDLSDMEDWCRERGGFVESDGANLALTYPTGWAVPGAKNMSF